jgi:hypothetical protein
VVGEVSGDVLDYGCDQLRPGEQCFREFVGEWRKDSANAVSCLSEVAAAEHSASEQTEDVGVDVGSDGFE